jgi:hypothetical protein
MDCLRRLVTACWAFGCLGGLVGTPAVGVAAGGSPQRASESPLAKGFAVVEFWFKRPKDALGSGEADPQGLLDPDDRPEYVLLLNDEPLRVGGLLIDARHVLVRDVLLDPKYIARIVVRRYDGTEIEGQWVGRLHHAAGAVISLASEGPWLSELPQQPPRELGNRVQFVYFDERPARQWALLQVDVVVDYAWTPGTPRRWDTGLSDEELNLPSHLFAHGLASIASPAVALGSDGQVLGLALGSTVSERAEGPRLLGAEGVRQGALLKLSEEKQLLEESRQRLLQSACAVTLTFRKAKEAQEAPPEEEAMGLVVGQRLIFVPETLARGQAALIEAIRIKPQATASEIRGRFGGALKFYEGYLVVAEEELVGCRPVSAWAGPPQPQQLVVAMNLEWAHGRTKLQERMARFLEASIIYGGKRTWRFAPDLDKGTAVFDVEGHLCGVVLRQREPLSGLAQFLPSPPSTVGAFFSRHNPTDEFVDATHLLKMAQEPASALDPRVQVLQPGMEMRRPWLGVEFTTVNRQLAEALGCRAETRDGEIGLLVQFVYPNSPAERIGLKTGDILLALATPEFPMLIELTGQVRPPRNVQDFLERVLRMRSMGMRQRPSGPWPSRENYLTQLLAVLGVGTPARLVYWRDGKVLCAEFTVEQAPPDQDSAEEYKDEQLGLTVKEVTYEVRAALRMGPDDPGLVVAEVEDGTPAAQARLRPGEVIVSVADRQVRKPGELKELVEKARREGTNTLRLRVMERGRARFADLRLR